ncbi:caspase family protein [Clostridium felsineum]|uniref:Peptidase C14 caspase domain-containing protein n=1 Tax=Clostridium felsineum TaxID=36839 RepID=A0A1S8LS64_9CLOT|nr:caspase family protein [Clostridium felsineum]URZ04712.1 hypothetical protein CLROS_000210 [Clostridium felsineum]URZ09685.1 hypothetical protein CROST_003780 [Clostridium felsineum]
MIRKALIIGLNNYPNAKLHGCINDAKRISNILTKNENGSPNFSVKLITDELKLVTKSELSESIEELFRGPSDVALMYFSGHGLLKSTGGYIVTPDYKRYDEGISMDYILSVANKSEASDKVIILDCCHSGAFGTPSIMGGNITQIANGVTILTSSRDTESSIEINGCGIFTSLLIDALNGGAADLRGKVTPGSLYSYVDEALGAWEQRPIFKTNVSKFTYIREVIPQVPLECLRKITTYFENPTDEYKLDPSYEFSSNDKIDKNVKIFKDLQKYQSVSLVVPVGADYMYFAAMNKKACKLTAKGYQYWRLVKENKI